MRLRSGFVDNQGNRANFHKQRIKVAKLHEKGFHQREDFLDKLSRRLVKENALIAIEDLNLKGMAPFNFGKHLAEFGWASLSTRV